MNKHYSNGPSLTFESATYTPQQIVTALQTLIALRAAVADAKATVKAKLAAESGVPSRREDGDLRTDVPG